MGLRARHEKEKENMKSLILNTAIKLIETEGYDKLSMRKIADAIDYSPTTIYIYYKDKAQIAHDISKQLYQKVMADVQKALGEHKEEPEDVQLMFAFKAFIYCITEHSEMGKAVMRSGENAIFDSAEQDDPETQGVVVLQKLLVLGQQRCILRPLDDNTAWMLISALLGFSMNVIENNIHKSNNWAGMVDAYAEILIKGILVER